MQLLLILAFSLAAFFVLFALQNAETVAIDLIAFQVESSLALVLISTFGLGILMGILISGYNFLQKKLQLSQKNKEINKLQISLQELKESKSKVQNSNNTK